MVTWIDSLDAACGPLTPAARRFAAEQGFPEDPPRGAPALRRLLEAIDRHSRSEAVTDEPFIEGAGAFLGLVLAERLKPASHVQSGMSHGLRLGRHGFFDPFACVAQTLSADLQSKALLSGIAEAEAEARATSHAACVSAQLADALETESAGAMSLLRRVGQRVWVTTPSDTLEVDIKGLLAATAGESAATVSEIIVRFARTLGGEHSATLHSWTQARTRLLPRLVGKAFEARIEGLEGSSHLALSNGPFGMRVALMLQYEGRARYVRRDELMAWEVTPELAYATALTNLRQRPTRLLRVGKDRAEVMVRTGDGYDSARILLPEVREALMTALDCERLKVALPHRDGLFACDADDAQQCEKLAERARQEADRAPHALSAELWPVSATTPSMN